MMQLLINALVSFSFKIKLLVQVIKSQWVWGMTGSRCSHGGGVYKLLSYIFHYVAFILRWVLPKWLCKWPAGTSRFTSRATSRKWKCLKKLYQLQKNPRADSDWLEQSHIFTPYQFPNSAQVCLAMWITCPPREPEDEVSSKVFIWAENGEQTSL